MKKRHCVVSRFQSIIFSFRETVFAKQNNAIVAISQTKLALGCAHSIRNVAVSFARLNLKIARQNCPRKSYNNFFSSSHVWSTANNSTRNLITIFVYLVVFISNINMAPINNFAIFLRLRSSINDVSYNNRTCNLRVVNLFFF
ncbi:Uncharacterised protein [Chlamydia trachomatis]|nr:Uncharacterised protein [Chlamydia trachomatis]